MYGRIIKSITTQKMLVDGVMQDVGNLHYLIQVSDNPLYGYEEIEDYNHLEDKDQYEINFTLEIIDDKIYKVYHYQEIVEVEEDGNL